MTDQIILLQLKEMPDNLKQQVVDFIGYLSAKYNLSAASQSGKKKHFGKYRGSLKTGMSTQDIDIQLQKLREK